jgi:glycosyltransferase involved in cell wall biosynthesis
MRVAYITSYNSEEVKHWSGTGFYIAEALKTQGIELLRIDCKVNYSFLQRLRRKLHKVLFNELHLLDREPAYLKSIAKKASQLLLNKDYDIIFSPGSLPITYLKTNRPIVFFTDATYDCLMNLYLKNKTLTKKSIENGNNAEAIALKKAAIAFYTSEWAIESAIDKYKVDIKKIRKINFGANIPYVYSAYVYSETEIRLLIAERIQKTTKDLLFIGVDWHRKGAKKAIETAAMLNAKGYQIALTIVGCAIPKDVVLPSFVKHYPFISKDTDEGRQMLVSLFKQASFFILPTEADCTPIVFSEAAAYGLPVITTNSGGCPSVILNKLTGYCVPPENFSEEASSIISSLISDQLAYERISLNAYCRFCTELNWTVIGKKVVDTLEPLLDNN